MFPDNPIIEHDLSKRFTHLIQQSGSIEFILPEVNHLNRMLFHNLPTGNVDGMGKIQTGGQVGQIKYFYIPTEKYSSLLKLLEQFKIPESLQVDLIGAYINMFFAKWTAKYFTQFDRNFKEDQNGLSDAMVFLSALSQNKINVTEIVLEYQDIIPDSKDSSKSHFGTKKKKKFQGTMPVGLLEEALKQYKRIQHYGMFCAFNESSNTSSKLDSFMGHKNSEKHSQSYYALSIFNYLGNTLFKSATELFINDSINYLSEFKRLVKIYSKRQRYLFIGKLMELAELVDQKEFDMDIIDMIQKKINPRKKNKIV